MTMIEVRLAKAEDADSLASELREADLQEIKAATGENPYEALKRSIAGSVPCYTIIDGSSKPLALFGVVPDPEYYMDNAGIVWFVGSDELLKHSVTFIRNCRKWIEKLHEQYMVLWNYVDVRNETHIRWLKWCGFTFHGRIEEYGVEGRPFYLFDRMRG